MQRLKWRGGAGIVVALIALGCCLVLPSKPPLPIDKIIDISWPNCSLNIVSAQWGIVGTTGGLDLRPNKCLVSEVVGIHHYSLYMNTGYPGISYAEKFAKSPWSCRTLDEACLAYNYGYNASLYAINYASLNDIHSNLWWLDVETDNSWSSFSALNRASLQGSIDAIRHTVILASVGIYSYPSQWQTITDNWHNGLPAWVATGSSDFSAASLACSGLSFNGGQVWLGQYTSGLDYDYPCSPHFFQAIL